MTKNQAFPFGVSPMSLISRRQLLGMGLVTGSHLALGGATASADKDLHHQILERAARQSEQRRNRFARVQSPANLKSLQDRLRQDFLTLLDGFPETGTGPAVRHLGRMEGDDYVVEKLALESLPGYWMSALRYRPKDESGFPTSAVLSPCGHSTVGKAASTYQIFHINLVKRGHIVLTYDPVGQGERSQFWDEEAGRSRFNLVCGEHCVLGNPLYLLGTSLAKYRIWDGMRALDHLVSLPEVDTRRIGCAGNSGGGTLTAYISALDRRVRAAVISCYITSLPHRMANRIQEDPDSDPEQDIFDFVGRGIDHAGLLALMAPRPTLLCSAEYDFFPIEGTRQTFAEAKRLYEVAGVADRIHKVETKARHGLSRPLREGAYGWFARWLRDAPSPTTVEEIEVPPREAKQLEVCDRGQVNLSLQSRPLLPVAWSEFQRQEKARRPRKPNRDTLRSLLRLDPEKGDFRLHQITPIRQTNNGLVLCVNGVESRSWQEERAFLDALVAGGSAVAVLDPRGVGQLRPSMRVPNHDYGDPLTGVEENIAYNAFLVGRTVMGMRVADVQAAIERVIATTKPTSITLCGRRDAALVACFAAAIDSRVDRVAVEEVILSFRSLLEPSGHAINAASLVPGLLRDFGDVSDVLRQITPRPVLVAAARNARGDAPPGVALSPTRFTAAPRVLTDWLRS